jgi:hypothetical protein
MKVGNKCLKNMIIQSMADIDLKILKIYEIFYLFPTSLIHLTLSSLMSQWHVIYKLCSKIISKARTRRP